MPQHVITLHAGVAYGYLVLVTRYLISGNRLQAPGVRSLVTNLVPYPSDVWQEPGTQYSAPDVPLFGLLCSDVLNV